MLTIRRHPCKLLISGKLWFGVAVILPRLREHLHDLTLLAVLLAGAELLAVSRLYGTPSDGSKL